MTKPFEILIATANRGKIAEMEGLFRPLSARFRSLSDFDNVVEVEETSSTFGGNSRLKAVGYARQTGVPALADDSGLEIAALDGAPGVLSARFGGDIGFAEKMSLILAELKSVEESMRRARFVCSMTLADPAGAVLASAEGECRGRIALEPRGNGGFGYDPIFIPEGFDRTFGELPDSVKAQISHRSRAAEKIMRYLLDFTGIPT